MAMGARKKEEGGRFLFYFVFLLFRAFSKSFLKAA
jgi:hypothetical protein